jgi:predicted ATP-binding protein involved in virulence
MPIQAASQGTLSVIAIFGLIYGFLHALRPNETEDKIRLVPAIVIIDEIDAHLHPSGQQKILRLLTSRFPTVQFIVSARSPLIVAGCDEGEVSVLRRREDTGGLYVYPPPGDFIGAKATDLYEHIFDIEEKDRTYLEYSAKTAKDLEAAEAKLSRLVDREDLSLEQEGKLADLIRKQRLITRTEEIRKERLED